MKKCKAENPATCRYHGKNQRFYEKRLYRLQKCDKKMAQVESLKELAALKKEREQALLEMDACAVGFKKLNKLYLKALKKGTVGEQAELAQRLQRATAARLHDGEVDIWARMSKSLFISTIFEQVDDSTTGKVEYPSHAGGHFRLAEVLEHAKNNGYEVVDIAGITASGTKATPRRLTEVLNALKTCTTETEMNEMFENKGVYLRKVHLRRPDKKLVTVSMSHKLREEITKMKI